MRIETFGYRSHGLYAQPSAIVHDMCASGFRIYFRGLRWFALRGARELRLYPSRLERWYGLSRKAWV